MLKYGKLVFVLAIIMVTLVACRGTTAGSAGQGGVGDPARGQALFAKVMIGDPSAPGCATCHSLEPGKTIVGPSLAGVATRAQQAEQGEDAGQYLRQSIRDPNAVIAPGFASGVMYPRYAENLTGEQIDDLVAYLLTLK